MEYYDHAYLMETFIWPDKSAYPTISGRHLGVNARFTSSTFTLPVMADRLFDYHLRSGIAPDTFNVTVIGWFI
jgi:hypothetical protein